MALIKWNVNQDIILFLLVIGVEIIFPHFFIDILSNLNFSLCRFPVSGVENNLNSWLVACWLRCPSAGSNLPHLPGVCVCVCEAAFATPPPRARFSTRNPRFSPAKLSQLKLGTFPRWLRTHDSHSRIATQRFNFGPLPRCLFIGLSRFIISDGKRRLNLSPAKQPNSLHHYRNTYQEPTTSRF